MCLLPASDQELNIEAWKVLSKCRWMKFVNLYNLILLYIYLIITIGKVRA